MKQLFFSLVALMCATMSYAQSSLIATLSHDGEISTFYGNGALREAHGAAEHGDIITLSSGSFTSVDITKAITLRGAGMQVDTIAKTNPTIITGDFKINIPDSVEQRLTMEGLFHNYELRVESNLKNATFIKNRFNKFYAYSNHGGIINLSTFIHCKITTTIEISATSASFMNCYLYNPKSSSRLEFTNCVVQFNGCNVFNNIQSSIFNNCIISQMNRLNSGGDRMHDTCSAFYCLGLSSNEDMFKNIVVNTTNYTSNNTGNIFKSYNAPTYTDDETFELTDEAKAKYLGSDGTEVGIHGGALPFDPTPTNPQITKCNVASKSTADGKLSVDIEVSAAE